MQYLALIICTTILFANDVNDNNNQKIVSDDISYNNYQYQQNRGGNNKYANQSSHHLNKAGQHLKNFKSRYYTGFALMFGGQLAIGVGAGSESPGTVIIGVGCVLVGSILSFLAPLEVGRAGDELQLASRTIQ